MAEPFDATFSSAKSLIDGCRKNDFPSIPPEPSPHIEGPRLRTKAESRISLRCKADVINMSVSRKRRCHNEAGILMPPAMSTDYAGEDARSAGKCSQARQNAEKGDDAATVSPRHCRLR